MSLDLLQLGLNVTIRCLRVVILSGRTQTFQMIILNIIPYAMPPNKPTYRSRRFCYNSRCANNPVLRAINVSLIHILMSHTFRGAHNTHHFIVVGYCWIECQGWFQIIRLLLNIILRDSKQFGSSCCQIVHIELFL